MKTLLTFALAATCLIAGSTQAGDLVVSVASKTGGGSLAIAVYRDADGFRRGEDPVRTLTIPPTGRLTLAQITGLAPGRYAVAVFHDTDGNGRLSTWPVGLPKEAYGFSRDARGRFGPPPFEAAAFDLPATGARQTITLK